jgi:CubicO group peptidase (beta-lactamase class C family)
VAILAPTTTYAQGERLWPTGGWPTSTPSAQGVDESVLDTFHQEVASGKHGYVDGMLVIRNGHVVYEKSYSNDYHRLFEGRDPKRWQYNYYDPDWHPYYRKGPVHTMQSVSKSVTSALVGIAIGEGKLAGVDVAVLPYFDKFSFKDSDPRWRAITLRDLLTMTSGIDWNESIAYTNPKNSCSLMEASENWVQFVLDQPMAAEPGRVFVYNSGVTMLLAQILFRATGKDPDAYAADHLFGPLGIESWYWKKTPTGLSDTEGGLYLTARDLAKIGYLYLNDGVWEGRRILPEGWVDDSTSGAVDASRRGRERRYGYQWWLLPYEGRTRSYAYAALGYGGQYLFVVPEYHLVAVFTGWNIYDRPPLDTRLALKRITESARSAELHPSSRSSSPSIP